MSKKVFYVEERAVRITNKNDIAAINFVALAVAKPREAYPNEYICIRNGKAISTDNYRIHCAKLETKIGEGLYRLVKSTKKQCIIERIWDTEGYPSQKSLDKYLYANGHKVEVDEFHINLPAAIVYLVGKNGQAMNPEYIIDACKFMPTGHTIVTLPSDPHCGVHIKHASENMEAYIMPLMLDSKNIIEGGD